MGLLLFGLNWSAVFSGMWGAALTLMSLGLFGIMVLRAERRRWRGRGALRILVVCDLFALVDISTAAFLLQRMSGRPPGLDDVLGVVSWGWAGFYAPAWLLFAVWLFAYWSDDKPGLGPAAQGGVVGAAVGPVLFTAVDFVFLILVMIGRTTMPRDYSQGYIGLAIVMPWLRFGGMGIGAGLGWAIDAYRRRRYAKRDGHGRGETVSRHAGPP